MRIGFTPKYYADHDIQTDRNRHFSRPCPGSFVTLSGFSQMGPAYGHFPIDPKVLFAQTR